MASIYIAPEMDETLTTLEEYPGVCLPPFSSSERKAILMKYWPMTLVRKVSAHSDSSERRKYLEMASALDISGGPSCKTTMVSLRSGTSAEWPRKG